MKKEFFTFQEMKKMQDLAKILREQVKIVEKVYHDLDNLMENCRAAEYDSPTGDSFSVARKRVYAAQRAVEDAALKIDTTCSAAWYQDAVYRMREDSAK